MAATIKALVALGDGVEKARIQQFLPKGSGIEVLEWVDGMRASWDRLGDPAADVVIVAVSGEPEDALAVVSGAVSERPERPVVVIGQASANGFVRRAFDAGADDIVLLSDADGAATDDVVFALQKAVARRSAPA